MTLFADPAADDRMTALRSTLAGARGWLSGVDARIVRLQVRLAEIPAPTGGERRRADVVARLLRRAGCANVAIDSAGNVRAERPGVERGPPAVVCAHLDTVFPDGTACAVRRDGSRLVGPGIGDNGRGLAVMLAIAGALAGPRIVLRRPLLFAATVAEEGDGDLRGAKHLFASLTEPPTAAIAIDGPGDDRIVHHAAGARRFRVVFTGVGGHSWSAYGTSNPIHAAADAATRLAAWGRRARGRTTLSVTRIGGGVAINAIPEQAWLDVDCRSLDAAALADAERAVERAASAAAGAENGGRATGSPPLAVCVTRIGDRPCGVTPASADIVRQAVAATRAIGRVPMAAAASTDANVPLSLGVPSIAIGGGGTGGGAHTTDEWYDNTAGARGVERALLIVAGAAA